MRHTTAIFAAIALTACAPAQKWVRPDADTAQVRQDLRECAYDALKATASIRSGLEAGWQQGVMERQCMLIRKYRQTPL